MILRDARERRTILSMYTGLANSTVDEIHCLLSLTIIYTGIEY